MPVPVGFDDDVAGTQVAGDRVLTLPRLTARSKSIKPFGFGFRRFSYYCTRALLYAGEPNWGLHATVTPR